MRWSGRSRYSLWSTEWRASGQFGAGGEEGETEVTRMGSGQPGGNWVTEGELGQVLRAAVENRRAATAAREIEKVAMPEWRGSRWSRRSRS